MKNNESRKATTSFVKRFKGSVRRFLVTLKKNPQLFPLASLCITFVYYTLNLSSVSKATASINKDFMGLCSFVTTLFMILSFVCMLNAFPKRQKPKVSMIIIMIALYLITIVADVSYINLLNVAFEVNYWTGLNIMDQYYIATAYNAAVGHIILTGVTIVLVLLEPIIAKLLKKINTSIDIEGSGNITNIDIAEED